MGAALDQVGRGCVHGPFPSDGDGGLVTDGGPQLASPAFRLEAQQGEELRAVDDLRRSHTNRAAAIQTPVNLPPWGHFATVITFRDKGPEDSLSIAREGRMDPFTQPPERAGKRMAAVATSKYPASGKVGGFRGDGRCTFLRNSSEGFGENSAQTVGGPAIRIPGRFPNRRTR